MYLDKMHTQFKIKMNNEMLVATKDKIKYVSQNDGTYVIKRNTNGYDMKN